ncbi:MAG: GAF domain-containing protein [Chloroflexi bacterium]|nr:GAF domain-containing protein [Chloroflexota bacterium]
MSATTPQMVSESITPPPTRGVFGRHLSLRLKLPLIVLFLFLLAFVISTVLSVKATQAALIDTLKGELTAQTTSKAELIRSNLIWTRSAAIDLAASAETISYDKETILKTIHNTLVHNEQIFGSTIAYEPYQFQPDVYYWSPYFSRTSDNKLKFTQLGNPDYNYFNWEWYTLPKSKGVPALSLPYFDEGGGEIWMVTWSAPFFDDEGIFKGVATADIAFSQTQDIVNEITVGKNGYAFLLDPQGVVLGIGSNGGEYNAMVDSMVASSQTPQTKDWLNLVSAMIAGNTGFAEAVDSKGQSMFVAYTPIGLDTGWSLGLAFPQEELFRNASQLQNTLIIYAVIVVFVFGFILFLYTRSFTEPLRRLAQHVSRFSPEQLRAARGQLMEPLQIQTRDELEDLATVFHQITTDLAHTFDIFEERIAERTNELEHRNKLLKAVADVGRSITSFRNLSELLQQTTHLIHENFGFYHVGIFLLDDHKEFAVLKAANSEGGQRMLERNHQLKVGETGIVGYVTERARARIALDVGKDAVFFNNPDLPETRSEMALPLAVGGQVLGALDVQSTESQAFTEEDIATLQILAEQLAVAIQNANLFNETESALEASKLVYGEVSREAWSKILRNQPRTGFLATPPATTQIYTEVLDPSISKAVETGDIIIGSDNLTISVPIKVRGLIIGAIRLKKNEISEAWTQDETNLAIALSEQLSGALESARLYRESQQRAARESLVSNISSRISAFSNVETILRETVQELGQTIGNASVTFQLLDQFDGQKQLEGQEKKSISPDTVRRARG